MLNKNVTIKDDITGKIFGRLTVLEFSHKKTNKKYYWLCRCICGKEIYARADSLKNGHTKSCGCLSLENMDKYFKDHGNKKAYGESSFRRVFYMYKRNAEKRGLSFLLTKDEFRTLTSQVCHYCGKEPNTIAKAYGRTNGEYIYTGIDRIDNFHGYDLNNCVPCCEICNRAKLSMTQEQFIDWIHKASNYLKNKEIQNES